jgi:hypothetical protein
MVREKNVIAAEIRQKVRELNALLVEAKEVNIVVNVLCHSNALSATEGMFEAEMYEKTPL